MYIYWIFLYLIVHPARGRVGRVTDCGVGGLGFKSQGRMLLLEYSVVFLNSCGCSTVKSKTPPYETFFSPS